MRAVYPACSRARAPRSLSLASRHSIRCTPTATSRRSSSRSMALPIPHRRQAGARLIRITHARSPPTAATATPTSSSPTTATTAGSCNRTAAIRSDRLNADASLLAAWSSHNRTTASRSSAWKSRTRHGAIASVCHHRSHVAPQVTGRARARRGQPHEIHAGRSRDHRDVTTRRPHYPAHSASAPHLRRPGFRRALDQVSPDHHAPRASPLRSAFGLGDGPAFFGRQLSLTPRHMIQPVSSVRPVRDREQRAAG